MSGRARRRLRWAAVAAAILAVVVLAFVLTRPRAEELRLRWVPGTSSAYRLSASLAGTLTGGGGAAVKVPYRLDVAETMTWTVRSVSPSGVATVDVSASAVTLKVNGQAVVPRTPPKAMMGVAADGRVISVRGTAGLVTGGLLGPWFPGLDQLTPVLPALSVKPGDQWPATFTQSFSPGRGLIPYDVHSSRGGHATVAGARVTGVTGEYTAPLTITLDWPPPGTGSSSPSIVYGGELRFTQTAWVDRSAGTAVKSESGGTFDVTYTYQGFQARFGTIGPPPALFGGSPAEISSSDRARFVGRLALSFVLVRGPASPTA